MNDEAGDPVVDAEKSAEQVAGEAALERRRVTDKEYNLIRLGVILMLLNFVLLIVLEVQIGRRNSALDETEQNLADIEVLIADLDKAVDETRAIALSFKEDREAPNPLNEQLAEVFRQVEEMHAEIVGAE